jgi:photosystem II stability/assembly factor-like uncharacterized protein
MRRHFSKLAIYMMLMAVPAGAQRPARPPAASGAATQPRFHAILEPISITADAQLTDVFFVTVDKGWVTSGEGSKHGALLQTSDGGTTWTTVLGDPEGSERPFYGLQFLDQTTGFVVQKTTADEDKLLRTTDGATWKVSGTLPHSYGYRFFTPTVGVDATDRTILRTTDGGRTWTKVLDCQIRLQVQGVNINTWCTIWSFSFASATVGYALAGSLDARGLYVYKTTDAGATWTQLVAQPGPNDAREGHIVFKNEKAGYVCLRTDAILSTEDGGVTWDEVPGSTCHMGAGVAFADPEVGWSVDANQFVWTTNGGAKWSRQQISAAYTLRAFSVPRRDRGYLVGDHGLIYRYHIVPVGIGATAISAPLMPAFSTAIEDKATELEQAVTQIETTLATVPADATAAGGANVTPAGSAATSTAGGADVLAPFLDKCCGKGLSSLDLIFKAVVGLVPDYTEKYKNLNLITLGLRIAGVLPDRTDSLRAAIKTFRSAKDKPSADQALASIKTALAGLRAAADTAVQKTP